MSAVKYIKRKNGESYPIRYEVNAYCHFEDITGKNLVSVISNVQNFDFRSIRAMILVGILYGSQYANKECLLTLVDIGRWDDCMEVFGQCMEILRDQSPQNKEGEKEASGE